MDKKIFTNNKFIAAIAALCCLLWGSAYPAVKNGYVLFNIHKGDVQSELVFAGYRFIIAGLMVLIIAKIIGRKLFDLSKKDILGLLGLGVSQTSLQYFFFYIGLANTTGVKGSILNSLGTFFSVILAHFIYKNDKLNKRKILGCIVGFVGVMIVNFSSDLINISFTVKGEGFVIIAAFVFAASAIYSKKLSKNIDVMLITGYNLFIGGVILAVFGLANGGKVTHFEPSSTSLLIYMGFLSAVAFSLWTLLLKYNKVGKVSIFNFLVPVFGAVLSSIFLGENILEIKNFIALIFVCIGIWFVNREKDIIEVNTNIEKIS